MKNMFIRRILLLPIISLILLNMAFKLEDAKYVIPGIQIKILIVLIGLYVGSYFVNKLF